MRNPSKYRGGPRYAVPFFNPLTADPDYSRSHIFLLAHCITTFKYDHLWKAYFLEGSFIFES